MSARHWISEQIPILSLQLYNHRLKELLLLGRNRLDRSPKTVRTGNHHQRGLCEVKHLSWDSVSRGDPVMRLEHLHLKEPSRYPPDPNQLPRIFG